MMTTNTRDEWKEVWDWAEKECWGPTTDEDRREVRSFGALSKHEDEAAHFTFGWFMRKVASQIARDHQWEELGSSDVWHATYDCVRQLKADGKKLTREEFKNRLCDYYGVYYF